MGNFFLVNRFKSTVCHFRALKLYIHRPRLETNCNLVSKSIIPPINLVNIPSNRGYIARIFQIWSKPEDYRELAGGFEPTRSGEIL